MSRSSIFSSDTVRALRLPRSVLVSWLVCLAAAGTAEVLARIAMAPLGDHVWTYGEHRAQRDKFEWYRNLSLAGCTPPVLIIGDSTAALNFNPAAFSAAAGVESYNLGYRSNYLRAERVNLHGLLAAGQAPEVVLAFHTPWGLVDSSHVTRAERSRATGVMRRRHAGEFVAPDVFHLGRLYAGRDALLNYWLRDKPIVQAPPRAGFEPLNKKLPFRPEVQLVPMAWGPDIRPSGFNPDRFKTVEELAALAKQRDFLLISVIGPFGDEADRYQTFWPLVEDQRQALISLQERYPEHLMIWDLSRTDDLPPLAFSDSTHVFPDSANRLSRYLGLRLHRMGIATSGEPEQQPPGSCGGTAASPQPVQPD
jgi:hypothetical protein